MSDPECLRIPLEHYPGMNRFVLDWMAGREPAASLLARGANGAKPRRDRHPAAAELAKALDASNRRWGIFAKEQLQRWAAGDAVTLIAGQQVGFAGGPLYTLAKAATLLKMKRELEAAGTPAVAFFWMATEDHDFDEVARLAVPVNTISRDGVNRQLDLLSIRATRSIESKHVVGDLRLPDVLVTELLALYGMTRPEWLREGITFRDSFAELLAAVLGSEVILVDALLPELRRAGAPLFERFGREWQAMQDALRSRAAQLQQAGYAPQVLAGDDGDYTLLFEIGERGDRRVVEPPLRIEPERTSTSALTRPLLQDFVFTPDVFVGGPAEVAYYAQLEPLHALLDVHTPRVALRGHALVAPKRLVRIAERFAISADELFTSADSIIATREPEAVAEVRRLANEAQQELLARIESIAKLALPAEHSLARSFTRSVGHIEYHFGKLTERAIKAIARKDRERWGGARELLATIHPDGNVQDRIVGWFPFWFLHGQHLVDRMVAEIEPDSDTCKVISI